MSPLERALLAIALIEAAALALTGGAALYLYRRHETIVRDLLNRLMSRDWANYAAAVPTPLNRPLRRRALSDEEMAEIEQAKIQKVVTPSA